MRKRFALALLVLTGCGRTITAPCWEPAYATDTIRYANGTSATIIIYKPCDG